MTKQELQQLRDLPIEGVAERLGLRVARHKSLCPFHDDHNASLSYNTRRNTFRCFVCGANGGTIDLVMNHLHMSFVEACRWLANDRGIILDEYRPASPAAEKPFDASRYERFFLHPWLSDDARRFLFQERHLDPRVISWCRVTSWQDRNGTPWLQIPYYSTDRQLIGLQNRNLNHQDTEPQAPRFRFPQGSRCTIYNLPVLSMLKPDEPLFITEGASDCWSLLSAGHKAIAIPSATLLKPSDRELFTDLQQRLHTSFHMYPDQDAPGQRLFLQLREMLPTLVHHALPHGCKDYSDLYVSESTLPHSVIVT